MINNLSIRNFYYDKYELYFSNILIAIVSVQNNMRIYQISNFDLFDQLNENLTESNQKLDSIIQKLEENFMLDLTA